MQSCLWWPQRLVVPSGSVPYAKSRSLRLEDSVVHQAVRVDLSKLIPLTALNAAAVPAPAVADSCVRQGGDPDDPDLVEPLL